MLVQQIDIYQDFAEFIASLSPEKLLAYYAPPKMQKRVDRLVALKKEGKITDAENQELEKYFVFEHIVRLAKTRALKIMATKKNE